MIVKLFLVLNTNIKLFLKKLFGCKIKYSPLTIVESCVTIKTRGKKSRIYLGPRAFVRKNTELSANGGILKLGNKSFVNRNCIINAHENITIGDGTTIGPGVYIYDHDHDGKGGYVTKPITIGKNVWIGAGCIILKGVTIKDNAVIGAGTLVSFDCESDSLVYQARNTVVKLKE